jgi:DNA polymerase III sliding clamp (beta) subunit (PCNA family)
MLATLRRVKGAVSTKDLIPAMTHFCIYSSRIQAMDGRIAIDAPLPELAGNEFAVPGEKLVKAIDLCSTEPSIKITDKTLTLTASSMKVRLPLLASESFPRQEPDLQTIELKDSNLIPTLKLIYPFIATDASKAWAIGSWLSPDGYALATNNVTLVQAECETLKQIPRGFNLPVYAIDELLRIGEEPVGLGIASNSVTFHFEGGWWLRAQLLSAEWPAASVSKLFSDWPESLPVISKDSAEALRKVATFCADSKLKIIKLGDGKIATIEGEQAAEIDGFDFDEGMFNADYLGEVFKIANRFGGGMPARFSGASVKGLITGYRA